MDVWGMRKRGKQVISRGVSTQYTEGRVAGRFQIGIWVVTLKRLETLV